MPGDVGRTVRPTRHSGSAGDIGVICVRIGQPVAPLILHGAPVGNRPGYAGTAVCGYRCVGAVKCGTVGGTARSVEVADDNLGIPIVLLVAEAVAVVTAEIIRVHTGRVEIDVRAVAEADGALETSREIMNFEENPIPPRGQRHGGRLILVAGESAAGVVIIFEDAV